MHRLEVPPQFIFGVSRFNPGRGDDKKTPLPPPPALPSLAPARSHMTLHALHMLFFVVAGAALPTCEQFDDIDINPHTQVRFEGSMRGGG